MKKTTNKDVLEKAIRLMQVIDRRKAFEKEEKELKDFFKTHLEEAQESSLLAGKILILISEKERTSLDRDALTKVMGEDIRKFEKVTTYKQVDIKAA